MHTYLITIIKAAPRPWPQSNQPIYRSEYAQTYTAQGKTWTEARENMNREHHLDHNSYLTWAVEEQS
jgi:hypothetical protein